MRWGGGIGGNLQQGGGIAMRKGGLQWGGGDLQQGRGFAPRMEELQWGGDVSQCPHHCRRPRCTMGTWGCMGRGRAVVCPPQHPHIPPPPPPAPPRAHPRAAPTRRILRGHRRGCHFAEERRSNGRGAAPPPWVVVMGGMASATDSRYGQKESSDQNFDYMFKILIIGNSSVGKTSFLFRYADDSFTPAFVSTVGIDFKVKTIYRNDKRIKLQIWDTAGQERYRTITTAYYRGAMGFILMYDITNEESFNAVQDWSTQIKTYSWDNAQVLLVGNKCDMEDERVVSAEKGRQLAEHLGFEFFEASAKDNINVKQTFERLVDIICEKMSESLDTADPAVTGAKQGPQLTDQQAPPHQDCAC
uniref:Ras-related protein Rab-3 n=2 Tax=Anatidae TaxID=8830 RepID=A0A8B9TJA8_ANAPL